MNDESIQLVQILASWSKSILGNQRIIRSMIFTTFDKLLRWNSPPSGRFLPVPTAAQQLPEPQMFNTVFIKTWWQIMIWDQKDTLKTLLVKGKIDQNLWSLGPFILTHSEVFFTIAAANLEPYIIQCNEVKHQLSMATTPKLIVMAHVGNMWPNDPYEQRVKHQTPTLEQTMMSFRVDIQTKT